MRGTHTTRARKKKRLRNEGLEERCSLSKCLQWLGTIQVSYVGGNNPFLKPSWLLGRVLVYTGRKLESGVEPGTDVDLKYLHH